MILGWKSRSAIDGKIAGRSLLIFVVLMAFFVPSFALFYRGEIEIRGLRDNFAATQFAERFMQLVQSQRQALEFLSYPVETDEAHEFERFGVWSTRVAESVRGFFAINWLDEKGVIRSVYPAERNRKALGRNVLERPELTGYLVAARKERKSQMTHFIDLYQGPKGLVIYVPNFRGDHFIGWINGVFSVDQLIGELLVTPELKQSYLRIAFKGHDQYIYEQGERRGSGYDQGTVTFDLMNQRVELLLQSHTAGPAQGAAVKLIWTILFGVVIASVAMAVIGYQLMASRQDLAQRLDKERVHGVLLNLLVHDIVNPLLIIRHGMETAARIATPEVQPALGKVFYGVTQISDVIARVKDMRAIETGRIKPDPQPVPINSLIDESLKVFEQRLNAKDLVAKFEHHPDNPTVLVDRVMFQNNVLNNLLSNAVKFSNKGDSVTVCCAGVEKDFAILEVRDHGVGMSPEMQKGLLLDRLEVSRPGTLGEKGTGIGLLQVTTLMKVFGGRVTVASIQKTDHSADHGTTFRLYLPVG